eukprot:1231149-Pleurochrysis_carterae.AAC.1
MFIEACTNKSEDFVRVSSKDYVLRKEADKSSRIRGKTEGTWRESPWALPGWARSGSNRAKRSYCAHCQQTKTYVLADP